MLNPGLDRARVSRRAMTVTIVLLAGFVMAVGALRAEQTSPLPLVGSVYDTTGAVMPTVVVKLSDSKENWQATTDSSGQFTFQSVAPGRYVIEAEVPGFRRLRQELELRQPSDWDRVVTMQVGAVQETVNVRSRRAEASRPADAQPEPRLRVGGNIKPPVKLKDVHPVYPESMREAGRSGRVSLEAVIGSDGSVRSVRALSADVHPDFVMSAADAVRQWRFSPTLLNGQPVEVTMTIAIDFSLED